MKNKVVVTLILCIALSLTSMNCEKEAPKYVIGINQFMQHPLLDDVSRGIIEELADNGISENKGSKIILKNANGDLSVAVQINKQFVDQKVDIIVPLGTPSAQSAYQLTERIPIIFGAITDPLKAGIVESLESPGRNITGTTDRWPYDKQVSLIRELVPDAQKVGIILKITA